LPTEPAPALGAFLPGTMTHRDCLPCNVRLPIGIKTSYQHRDRGIQLAEREMTYPEACPTSVPPDDLLRRASLFLDFDGTLVEIAPSPDSVQVDARLAGIIRRLARQLEGRLAVISGRPAVQVRNLIGTDVTVVGSHGMEFICKEVRSTSPQRPGGLDETLDAMRELAGRHAGLAVEDKPLGAALHYRGCPAAEAECVRLASELANRHALHLQPGKMVVEVRAAGGDKGTAIRTLMREPKMAGTRPVFMGDDLTDDPGFAAAVELGGAGILVGEPRQTAARYRLEGVEAALAWLEAASAKAG
jgi:trehalose 6-phosphate phosphatase